MTNQIYRLLLLAVLVVLSISINLPQCQVGSFYRTLPLIAHEKTIVNLDQLFTGYNLNFSLNVPKEI